MNGLASADSQLLIRRFYELTQAVHNKTRSYNSLVTDFQNLIERYDRCRKFAAAEQGNTARAEAQLLQSEQARRELQERYDEKARALITLEAQLKHANSECGKSIGYIQALEADRDELENRLNLVKKNLQNQLFNLPMECSQGLAFMKEPALYRSNSRAYAERNNLPDRRIEETVVVEEENIDYDVTTDGEQLVDEVENRTPARASRHTPTSRKSAAASAHPPLLGRMSAGKPRMGNLARRRSSRAEMTQRSVLMGSMQTTTTVKTTVKQLGDGGKEQVKTTVSVKRNSCTPRRALKNWTNGHSINKRPHQFVEYTGMTKKCVICKLGFFMRSKPAVRCGDCDQHAHEKCMDKLPAPCIPQSFTPRSQLAKAKVSQRLPLYEYCPPMAPMVPGPVVKCVAALEAKGLDKEGIYRIPGSISLISKALDGLLDDRKAHPLHEEEPEVLTGCIKKFLRELRDPLIPKTSRQEFIRAAETRNREELVRAIDDLPQANRDTLAYLCKHWNKVIALSATNKMTLANLARCLAPTVVGGEGVGEHTLHSAGVDTNKAILVLEMLLETETEYWQQYLQFEEAPMPLIAPRKSIANTKRGWIR